MKTCKISKKLVQQVTSLCNIWIENPHVISEIIIWAGKKISIHIGIWALDPYNNNVIKNIVCYVYEAFYSEEEFINNKQKIIDKVNKILKDNAYL